MNFKLHQRLRLFPFITRWRFHQWFCLFLINTTISESNSHPLIQTKLWSTQNIIFEIFQINVLHNNFPSTSQWNDENSNSIHLSSKQYFMSAKRISVCVCEQKRTNSDVRLSSAKNNFFNETLVYSRYICELHKERIPMIAHNLNCVYYIFASNMHSQNEEKKNLLHHYF